MTSLRLILTLLLLCLPQMGRANDKAGEFDYYVLAITWLPSFCDNARTSARAACQRDTQRFVVHGLWPQNETSWPQYCPAQGKQASDALLYNFRDLFSSMSSALYQWRKHGACSGLEAATFFSLTRAAYDKLDLAPLQRTLKRNSGINTPRARRLLLDANPKLNDNMFKVISKKGMIEEIRVCLTRQLAFRRCGS